MRLFKMIPTLVITMTVGLVLAGVVACGSSSTGTGSTTDARTISGELITQSVASIAKAVAEASAADVVSVKAINSAGEVVSAAVNPETNMWEIQLQPGEWMIGFFDSADQLIGYLDVEGSTAFKIDSGDAINLGSILLVNGLAVLMEDIPGLGERGFRSMYGQDDDFDGIHNEFDDDELVYDPSIFSVIKVKPFNGHEMVAPCRPVKLYFSQAVDVASVTADTLIVTDANGAAITGTISYEVDDLEEGETPEYEVKFAPDGGFALASIVNVVATQGILNADGVALDKEYAFSFTVRDFGGTSQICHDMDSEHREMEREQHQGGDHQNQEQNGGGGEAETESD